MISRNIRFCPFCGEEFKPGDLSQEFISACLQCGSTYYKDPKVAVAVVLEVDGSILLTRRGNQPYQGFWSLPAGFVNEHEILEEAAARECLEETGLQIQVSQLVDVYSGREHPQGADILIVYRGNVIGGTLKAGDDAVDAAFHKLDQLPPLAFHTTQKILGILRTE
jgi:8-oxo-dGTP diphosphatase